MGGGENVSKSDGVILVRSLISTISTVSKYLLETFSICLHVEYVDVGDLYLNDQMMARSILIISNKCK